MKTNQKMTIKLMTLIATVIFSLSTVFAHQPGIIDIIMRGANNNTQVYEQLQVPVEQSKLYSIVLISDSSEKFEQKIRPASKTNKVSFVLSTGIYKVVIVEIETGRSEKYTINLL